MPTRLETRAFGWFFLTRLTNSSEYLAGMSAGVSNQMSWTSPYRVVSSLTCGRHLVLKYSSKDTSRPSLPVLGP